MARTHTFKVDASSILGQPGTKVTFISLKRGDWKRWKEDDSVDNADMLIQHVKAWDLKDPKGHVMPIPKDEPGILDDWYMHEVNSLVNLLFQGPDGPEALKN